jgi:hypothetical protein
MPELHEKTNPAKRILAILEVVRQQDKDVQVAWAWCKAFGLLEAKQQHPHLTTRQRTDLLVMLAEFHKEIDCLEELIRKKYPDNPSHILEHFEPLRQYASVFNFGNTLHVERKLNEGVYVSLGHLAYFLPDEETVSPQELTNLINRIHRLRDFVRNGNLDHDFKTWLVNFLNEALFKLDQYKLHGAKIFRSVYKAMTVEIAERENEIKRTYRESPEGKSAVEQIFGVWSNIRRVSTVALKLLRFGAAFGGFIATVADTPIDDSEKAVEHLTTRVIEELEAIPETENLLTYEKDKEAE